jgi:ribonuclease E
MLEDHQSTEGPGSAPTEESAPTSEPAETSDAAPTGEPAKKTAAKKAAAKKTAKKAAAKKPAAKKTAKKTTAKKTAARKDASGAAAEKPSAEQPRGEEPQAQATGDAPAPGTPAVLFQAPDTTKPPARKSRKKAAGQPEGRPQDAGDTADAGAADAKAAETDKPDDSDAEETEGGGARRRRRRGGRRRRKSADAESDTAAADESDEGETAGDSGAGDSGDDTGEGGTSRRRRRRRRAGDEGDGGGDDPANTVTKVRQGRAAEDQITALSGSTRLEAKKQRRREGREAGRRRAPIVSEAEFLARREAVERVMVIRQREELTQIAVLEDKVLVEHYVARESQTSLIGNVYLGRVQNVLPSMEAAFIDIGKGRNAVLYAGEVNWSGLGHKEGQPRKIESVLSSGQSVLVQVTKDPVGHKGARLTSQISLAGRFLVYVPDGTTSGISRKLPDTERNRLKSLLKDIVPESAGVIVRTAAEGASEDELTRDVERLKARWEDIESKAKGKAPQALYTEPDLTLKVVRDLFTEDFKKLVVEGEDAWETVRQYVGHVAPDLEERLERHEGEAGAFATYRIDEQIAKGLDRKVWLPSGGSLIIDRTEAMTVVDVNTGKFTGSGGNLEETVTKNNLEAAEEIVRQLRLRDIGGIIVVDFIDMVLESNRDLVLRRLVECLGRDRTRHQVAEVTSLGLVQMTRKRIGTGLLEAFSESCEACQGRGLIVKEVPVEPKKSEDDSRRGGRRGRGGRGRGGDDNRGGDGAPKTPPSPKDLAAMARHEPSEPAETADEGEPTKPPEPESTEPKETDLPTEVTSPEETPSPAETEPPAASAEPAESPDQPQGEPVDTPASQEPPEKPKVVTRSRRRSASRPAGPPGASTGQSGPTRDVLTEEPAATGQVGAPADSGQVEPGTVDAEPGSGAPLAAVEHVPIKKKGSRKR